MKFDKPASQNPIDQMKVIGQPRDRIDGPLKVTGTARYAYEQHDVVPNQAYGYVVGAGIAKGRITAVDTVAAAPFNIRGHNYDVLLGLKCCFLVV